MPLLQKKIAQMEGKSQEEIKNVEEEARKGMTKALKRYAILAVIILVLCMISIMALFLYAIR